MSVVACRITANGYEIAADSITVRGWTQSRGEQKGIPKLFEVNDLVIGSVGRSQDGALMQLFAKTHQPAGPTEEGILEFFSELYDWKKKKTDDDAMHNEWLVGFEGSVFNVEQWLISRVRTFYAIGAGMDFALAALHLDKSPKDAVEIAIELSAMCESPVIEIKKPRAQ